MVQSIKWYKGHFHKDLSVPFLSGCQDQGLAFNQHKITTTEVSVDSNLEQATDPEADDTVGKEREDIALLF